MAWMVWVMRMTFHSNKIRFWIYRVAAHNTGKTFRTYNFIRAFISPIWVIPKINQIWFKASINKITWWTKTRGLHPRSSNIKSRWFKIKQLCINVYLIIIRTKIKWSTRNSLETKTPDSLRSTNSKDCIHGNSSKQIATKSITLKAIKVQDKRTFMIWHPWSWAQSRSLYRDRML